MKKLTILTIVLFALVAFGCQTPTDPDVTIFTDGRVTAPFAGAISCEDDSRTIPEGKVALIQWIVRSPAGNTADSGTTAVKGEITFIGLPAGDYVVEQTAHLKNGDEGPPRVHPVTVF